MDVKAHSENAVSRIAAAIGEPARVRMLQSLLDGHARTSTELSVVAGVSPSTASVHLHRLQAEQLIKVFRQGKHHYYSLEGPEVAATLEALHVVAGVRNQFVPNTPDRLLAARTCYDHLAGRLGVMLHNRFKILGWISGRSNKGVHEYDLTAKGAKALSDLGLDVAAARSLRRRFAYPCLDWSERQPHIGGALGAAVLTAALKKKWVSRQLDSRALDVTSLGRRELQARFGVNL